MEKWDIFDSRGQPTGRTVTRGRAIFRPGEYHLVVHIWIVDSAGRFLLQRRSDEKKLMPGEWAATGGAATAGEDSFTAARRELYEELGISATRETLREVTRLRRKNSFVDLWLLQADVPLSSLRLQPGEVACAKWVTRAEFEAMIADGRYHNYGAAYFKILFRACDRLTEPVKETTV